MALVFNTPKSALNTTSKAIQNLSSDCPPCPEVNLTTADVEYTENGEYTVTPEAGYDGLTQVDITVNVPSVKNQDKLVVPTTSSQTITADSGYSGIGTVSVEAVTSSIDANITAGNIKKNVSILGVTGSYDPQPDLETKTVTYTTNDTYTITPTAGKDGMSSVEVTVNVTGSNCPDWSSMGWSCEDVTASGITGDVAVTAALLENYDPNTSGISYWKSKQIVYAPNIVIHQDPTVLDSGTFAGNAKLEFLPQLTFKSGQFGFNIIPSCNCNGLFTGCTSLKKAHLDLTDYGNGTASNGYVIGGKALFMACSSLTDVELVNTNGLTSGVSMFYNCTSLVTAPTINTSNITDMTDMFYGCTALTTIPTYDTSNVTNMYRMFNGCISLTSVPSLNTSKVTNMESVFGYASGTANALQSIGQWDCTLVQGGNLFSSNKNYSNLTTIGGFVNLGKSFKSGNNHTLDLKKATNLTKQSLMNIINNLAAPDDTSITDATLKLSTTSYALLDASEIAIATAKNWTITTS